jgi:hypothetical protein
MEVHELGPGQNLLEAVNEKAALAVKLIGG